jgi:suppressor of ftsI
MIRSWIAPAGVLLTLVMGTAEPLVAQLEIVSAPRGRRLSTAQLASAACVPYAAPGEVRPVDGNLVTELVMAPARFRIGDSTYTRNVYNGEYVAPVLRMSPTRQLNVNVTNNMRPISATDSSWRSTNQHYHGMIVTPLPPMGDNVTNVHIAAGQSNRNQFPVPSYQSEGMMWYHPHPHGTTAAQVAGGLAGALIIGDLLASYPQYRGATERVMYVKDTRDGGTAYLNINGNPCTLLAIAPGEQQLWRIGNMTAGTWLNLKLGRPGRNYPFIVLALDGNHLTRPARMDSVFIAPGSRAEVIVIGGTGEWQNARFYTDAVASSFNTTTGQVNRSPAVDLGALTARGTLRAVAPEALAPETTAENAALVDSIRRLVTETDVDTFTIRYQRVPGGLGLNGRLYDPRRLDRSVAVGRTQEWTLINETSFLHTFHIHQTDFVVTRINGVPQPDSVHLDNVHLGIHQRGGTGPWVGDTVVIRFKFNPIAAGPFVYHCHDLFHEDAGMMANVCVYDPARGQQPGTCTQWFPGGATAGGGHGGHGSEESDASGGPGVVPRRE